MKCCFFFFFLKAVLASEHLTCPWISTITTLGTHCKFTHAFHHRMLSLFSSQLCFPTRQLGIPLKVQNNSLSKYPCFKPGIEVREERQLNMHHGLERGKPCWIHTFLFYYPMPHDVSWRYLAFSLVSNMNTSSSVICLVSSFKVRDLANYAPLDLLQPGF
jgi:hypothetical protein